MKKNIKTIKSQNNKKGDNIVWIFYMAGMALFILMFLLFFASQSVKNDFVNSNSIEQYAAGPKVSYADPLITDVKIKYPKVQADDVRKGSASAKVTIFFYCDLLSPLCKDQQAEIYKLWALYSEEELRVVWKGTAATTEGFLAQQASYCAQAQNKFWEYQQIVFNEQKNIDTKSLERIAQDLLLDMNEFNTCVAQARMEDKVYQNNIEASDLGIDALPYFFIDNTPYRGFFSYQELGNIIDTLTL